MAGKVGAAYAVVVGWFMWPVLFIAGKITEPANRAFGTLFSSISGVADCHYFNCRRGGFVSIRNTF